MAHFPYLMNFLIIFLASATFDGSSFNGALLTEISQYSCIRLFHTNGSIGCFETAHEGSTLPLEVVESSDFPQLKSVVSNNLDRCAVVINAALLNNLTLRLLLETKKVGGILVLSNDLPNMDNDPKNFLSSQDAQAVQGIHTPSSKLTMNNQHNWNPFGNGLIYKNVEIPIILVNKEDSQHILEKAYLNRDVIDTSDSSSKPIWVTDLDFYFGPINGKNSNNPLTSQECLTWVDKDGTKNPKCLPLGGQSVWGTFSSTDTKPIVMAVAGMDSTAMFHDASFGLNDAAVSLIVLLASADTISSNFAAQLSLAPNTIGFGLFQGDEFGFIGSRKLAQDISQNEENGQSFTCFNKVFSTDDDDDDSRSGVTPDYCLDPIYPSLSFEKKLKGNIVNMVAIDQVGLSSELFLHQSSTSLSSLFMDTFSKNIDVTTNTKVSLSSSDDLPPSPLTSFLRSNSKMYGAVLSGYDTQFSDSAFHSPYDTSINNGGFQEINKKDLISTIKLLSQSLYDLAITEQSTSSSSFSFSSSSSSSLPSSSEFVVSVNETLVDELVSCFTVQGFSCPAFEPYFASEVSQLSYKSGSDINVNFGVGTPPSYYTSILSSYASLPVFVKNNKAYGRYAGDVGKGKIVLKPSALEMFLRSFLASRLDISSSSERDITCRDHADCEKITCKDFDDNQNGRECVLGQCLCSLSFYHIAIDTGLVPEATVDHFTVIDASSTPIYAEPNWYYIGASVYQIPGSQLELWIFYVGLVVFGLSIFLSQRLAKALSV